MPTRPVMFVMKVNKILNLPAAIHALAAKSHQWSRTALESWNRRGRGHAKTSHHRNVGEPVSCRWVRWCNSGQFLEGAHFEQNRTHTHTRIRRFSIIARGLSSIECCGALKGGKGIFCSVLHMYKHPSSGVAPAPPSEKHRKQIWPAAVIWCSLMNLGGFHAAKLACSWPMTAMMMMIVMIPIYTIVSPPWSKSSTATDNETSRPLRPSEKPF